MKIYLFKKIRAGTSRATLTLLIIFLRFPTSKAEAKLRHKASARFWKERVARLSFIAARSSLLHRESMVKNKPNM
jgi:hypothetical protein